MRHGTSIESGFFVFTMMPSLQCSLNCPHCYLSLEQRRDKSIMSLDALEKICRNIDAYFERRQLPEKRFEFYWYGGEPTDMGRDYFESAVALLNRAFPAEKGYVLRHTVLTSMITVDPEWYEVWHRLCDGRVQSSFDGLMRGMNYVKRWEGKIRGAIGAGLRISTLSVVNSELISAGAARTLDYLADLGVAETGWLPFMLNDQNAEKSYATFAPSMNEYSDFMMALSDRYFERKAAGLPVPEIGQLRFVMSQAERGGYANIAGQTLFLLPNGDFALPDYRNGYQEYLRVFGNALTDDFGAILTSSERRDYLRRQIQRNGNPECLECPHAGSCVMEFWKPNKEGDDCFGGRRFVEWVKSDKRCAGLDSRNLVMY